MGDRDAFSRLTRASCRCAPRRASSRRDEGVEVEVLKVAEALRICELLLNLEALASMQPPGEVRLEDQAAQHQASADDGDGPGGVEADKHPGDQVRAVLDGC